MSKKETKEEKKTAEKPEAKKAVKRERKPKEMKKVEYDKVYTIPLRKVFNKTRQRRAPYAARLIKSFLKIHLKAPDVDYIKIGPKLNEKLWERSIQKPPRRVRVGVRKSENRWLAELEGFEFIEFRATESKKPEGMAEKLAARIGGKAAKNEEEEKLIGGKASESEKKEAPKESKVSEKTE